MRKNKRAVLNDLNQQAEESLLFTVESLSHEGRGLSKEPSGKKVFIEGALPGEVVKVQYTQGHKRYMEARVTEVITASADRAEALCPHFAQCGGCLLQHMEQGAQILFKQSMLTEQLKHITGTEPKEGYLPPVTGPAYAYRKRARLSVKYVEKKDKVLVGFREKSSSFLVDMNSCVVLDERVGLKIEALKNMIMSLSIRAHIPQIEVAASDEVVVLIFRFLVDCQAQDLKIIADFCKENQFHFYAQREKIDSIVRIYPPLNELTQTASSVISDSAISDVTPLESQALPFLYYHLADQNVRFAWKSTDFTQINPKINEKMVALALELLDLKSTDQVLDLFCGLGNFTLPIARKAAAVVGVEGTKEMVLRGNMNASLNDIQNASFVCANLFEDFSEMTWVKTPFDKILMDPPRLGAEKVVEMIHLFTHVTRIVYVSCHPATLARDAALLAQSGFYLVKAGVLDMFPHTQHVESIALFIKK